MKLQKKWWLLVVLSLGVMIPFSTPYFALDPANSRIPIVSSTVQFPLLIAHIGTAMIALIVGLMQFINYFRLKRPNIHRYLGRIYVICVIISGLTAIGLFFYESNYVKAMSFFVLSVLWLFTCWKGYRAALNKRWDEHRIWMFRSMAMTLVAVCARLLVPFLILAYLASKGFSVDSRKVMIDAILNVNIWTGIVINLIIVEWWIFGSRKK